MKLYVEVYFTAGADPIQVAEDMEEIGFKPVMGEYDFVQEYNEPKEYGKIVRQVQKTLRGNSPEGPKIYFRLNTMEK